MNLQDRFRGSILGLACGDAVGTTLEFKRPGTFETITDAVGGGPFKLEPGQWTDDTSMMLCLGTSLVLCEGFDAIDQMKRYTDWFENGYMSSNGKCFDVGNTIYNALQEFARTGAPYCGSRDSQTAGNG
jgi:ADP-ribosylglycohydrolase